MGDESSETQAKALFLKTALEKPGVTYAICLIERYSALMEPLARKHQTVGVSVTSEKSVIASLQSVLDQDRMDFTKVVDNTRRMPSLIELQTFFSDAVRIVNDRPLTTLSDQPNDLLPICPSSFLGGELAPNTPVGGFHDKEDLRKDFLCNANMAHRFWLGWMQGYLPLLQKRNKWRTVQHNLQPGQLVLVEDDCFSSERP